MVNESLNNFLSDTKFPYTPSSSFMAGMTGGTTGGTTGGGTPGGAFPSGGPLPSGGTMMGGGPSGAGGPSGGTMPSGGVMGGGPGGSSGSTKSTTYKTVQEYFTHLNSGGTWVTYDAATNTAKVASLEGFVKSQKTASKSVGAFDGPARDAGENAVMGNGTAGLHYATVSRDIIAAGETAYAKLSGWKNSYASSEYDADFKKTDSVGENIEFRRNAYNPMYYLNNFYEGYKSATVAPHWRIRTGIMQGDTANTTEVNLALALTNYGATDVDFATVWGLAHTMAERTGDPDANFITWVKDVVAK